MTELSAQPITLTGEQHDRLWKKAKAVRRMATIVDEDSLVVPDGNAAALFDLANEIEATLIAAHEAGGSAAASPGDGSLNDLERRACTWVTSRDTGLSSESLWSVMMGVAKKRIDHPHDPDDMGRCLRLLRLIPEWRPRLGEMAEHSPEWAALAARWDEIETVIREEVGGIDPAWNARSPRGYALMRSILDPIGRAGRAGA